ncbi:hypothetical protein EDC04DRAFT_2533485, partial [Pisolithus marmoratus]
LMFHDIIVYFAQAQHTFLNIYAFMEYVEVTQPHITYPAFLPHTVNETWMGCFTTDLKVCHDLFHACVPIWLIHGKSQILPAMNVKSPVVFTYPDHIVRKHYYDSLPSSKPFPLL